MDKTINKKFWKYEINLCFQPRCSVFISISNDYSKASEVRYRWYFIYFKTIGITRPHELICNIKRSCYNGYFAYIQTRGTPNTVPDQQTAYSFKTTAGIRT